MRLLATTAATLCLTATGVLAHGETDCAVGKTLEEGVLTIATGNPAFYPWVLNDDPESGEGFEAAVAYAIAEEMGFATMP
jgi:polar amino acid transport system substrate-binding protein